jgi:23S rRNA pseudouridine955/2504/2580 synthase
MRELGLKRLFLHANALEFKHPVSGERISVEAPLSKDLKTLLNKLK